MKKFKTGDWIIATKTLRKEVPSGFGIMSSSTTQEDSSYTNKPMKILHVATHHYVCDEVYGGCITFEEIEKRGFVKATKRMVSLVVKEET